MISIIIPLYNKEECIAGVIESVLKQSFVDFELLIINDGSTDNSESKVGLFTDSRIKLHNKQNGGVSSARNYGVKMAKSEWVIFLDADDIMLPNCLDTLYAIQLNYAVDIATANFFRELKDRSKVLSNSCNNEGVVRDNFYSYYMGKYAMRMGAALIRKRRLLENPFSEQLNRFEDMAVILDLLRSCTIAVSPDPVMIYTYEYRDLCKNSNTLEKDFTAYLDFSCRGFWEKMMYGELIVFASYNKVHDLILRKQYCFNYYIWKWLAIVGFKLKKIKHLIEKYYSVKW